MEKITSFTIDHLKLVPGLYVSRKDCAGEQVITTFDIRMTNPNEEPVMNTAEVHTIEHLGATFLRNHRDYASKTLYFGPMGCRTGFYLLLVGDYESKDIVPLMKEMFAFIADFNGDVPGASAKDCGNYLDMNLPMANYMAKRYLTEVLENITEKQLDALEENIYLSEFHASKGHAQKLTELDDQFHDILYEACSSKMLEHQLRDFHEYVRRMRKQNLSGSERGLEAVLEHKQIMEAICRKDADRAQELAALHMRNAYDNMIKNGLLDAYDEKERIDG